jgi:hypothetical protein
MSQQPLVHQLTDARQIIEAWRQDYNQVRPHSSLKYATPHEVYEKLVGATAMEHAAGFSQCVHQRSGADQNEH